MKEIIISINKKIDLLNESITLIRDLLINEYCLEEFDPTRIKNVRNKINKLRQYNSDYHELYYDLQAFHYAAVNYDTVFFEEIESKWLDIQIQWFELEDYIPKTGWDIDSVSIADIGFSEDCFENLTTITQTVESILISDTKGLNRFSLNYLNNKRKNLISFTDYRFLYAIKKEYDQKRKRIDEILQFGEEALTVRDKKSMRINDFKLEEYIHHLKVKSEDFYSFKSFKSHKSDFLEENKSTILSNPYKFSFVNSIDYINSRTSQKDYYIEQAFAYIINHKEEFGISISKNDFEYLIVNKKLPSQMNKIVWKGTPTDAFVFCKLFDIEISRFNRCFNLSNGKLLKSNSAGKNPQTDFAKFTRNLKIEFDSPI